MPLTIVTRFTQRDFIKVAFVLSFRKAALRVLLLIALGCMVACAAYIATSTGGKQPPYFTMAIIPYVLIVLPYVIYRGAKKNFSTNLRLQESISYTFDTDKIIIAGESFRSETDYTKIYKILELKDWFLIYQSRQSANFIHKASLSETQIQDLRALFRAKAGQLNVILRKP